jgi:hypothetical protein
VLQVPNIVDRRRDHGDYISANFLHQIDGGTATFAFPFGAPFPFGPCLFRPLLQESCRDLGHSWIASTEQNMWSHGRGSGNMPFIVAINVVVAVSTGHSKPTAHERLINYIKLHKWTESPCWIYIPQSINFVVAVSTGLSKPTAHEILINYIKLCSFAGEYKFSKDFQFIGAT